MPSVRAILVEAAALVEQGWCQDVGARDAAGYPVAWNSASARSWCARGALHKAASGPSLQAERALRQLVGHIGHWNDEPGRKMHEVAKALRDAAELA